MEFKPEKEVSLLDRVKGVLPLCESVRPVDLKNPEVPGPPPGLTEPDRSVELSESDKKLQKMDWQDLIGELKDRKRKRTSREISYSAL